MHIVFRERLIAIDIFESLNERRMSCWPLHAPQLDGSAGRSIRSHSLRVCSTMTARLSVTLEAPMIRAPSRIGRVATPIRLHGCITPQRTSSPLPGDRVSRPTTVVCPPPILMLPPQRLLHGALDCVRRPMRCRSRTHSTALVHQAVSSLSVADADSRRSRACFPPPSGLHAKPAIAA